jgi:hypothetical protein
MCIVANTVNRLHIRREYNNQEPRLIRADTSCSHHSRAQQSMQQCEAACTTQPARQESGKSKGAKGGRQPS